MGSLTAVMSLVGISIAVGAILLLGHVSGLTGGSTDLQLLGGAIVAFLLGIFVFGWSLGKRTQTRY